VNAEFHVTHPKVLGVIKGTPSRERLRTRGLRSREREEHHNYEKGGLNLFEARHIYRL
jgi:hypothetical protein